MNYTWLNGDLAKYTGRTENLHGGIFYEVEMVYQAGNNIRYTPYGPSFLPCGCWVTKEEVIDHV